MKTNKIIALFVLALLIFSVPIFAQDAADTTDVSDPNRVQHGKDINIIEKTKDNSVDAKGRFVETRDALKNGKAEILACKDVNSASCETKRAAYVEKQVEYLKAVRDRIYANLDLIDYYAKNYIQDSENRAQVVNHVKDIKDQVNEMYSNIDNIQTLEEAKNVRDKLQVKFKSIRDAIKQYNAETQRAKLQDVNAKLVTLNAKVQHAIDNLESKGVNLGTEYPAKVEQLNAALASAQFNLDLARSTYNQIKSTTSDTEKQTLIAQSKNYADKAREYLKNARNHLHDLITSIRSRAGNQEFAQAVATA